MFLKIPAQSFEAGDFLNIFRRFLGFSGLFYYKDFSYENHMYSTLHLTLVAPGYFGVVLPRRGGGAHCPPFQSSSRVEL